MLRHISQAIKHFKKTTTAVTAIALAAAFVAAPLAVYAGHGPSDPSVRPTYDYSKYDASKSCTDKANAYGKCGSMHGPVFDSFINNPVYGDEENFNTVAPVKAGQSPQNADFSETATHVKAGHEYWVRTYVHNDANQNLNCKPEHDNHKKNDCTQIDPGSTSIANNTHVRMKISGGSGNQVQVMTYISADNAKPGRVWDSSNLRNNDHQFSVSYVKGSAVIYNDFHKSGLNLSDAITSNNGVKIGAKAMNGHVPGCFHYSSFVYVKVKVHKPALTINKQVRLSKSDDWSKSVKADKQQKEEWRITYRNSGSAVDNHVNLRDILPQGLTLVSGSIKWYDANNNGVVQKDTALDGQGIDLGSYSPVGNGKISGMIEFYTTVDKKVPSCSLTNIAYGSAEHVPYSSSKATVNVNNCHAPTYSCTVLGITGENSNKATINKFQTSAKNGAHFDYAVINWGDSSAPLKTNHVVGTTHSYANKNDSYTVKATAYFSVNGKTVKAPANSDCQAAKTVKLPPKTPMCTITGKHNLPASSEQCVPAQRKPQPKKCTVQGKHNLPANSAKCVAEHKPTSLPNTGPGAVIALFAGASVIGAILHRVILARRFSRG
jgi:uncharacterized repeat protein (TIGR01451 family)